LIHQGKLLFARIRFGGASARAIAAPHCVDGTRRVKSNVEYWSAKVAGNRARDKRNVAALRRMGWLVFTIWECEVKNKPRLAKLAKRIKALTGDQENDARQISGRELRVSFRGGAI
jgi:G:T-mismatch repair DNA endonuclease (very short patch repair protein)